MSDEQISEADDQFYGIIVAGGGALFGVVCLIIVVLKLVFL